MSGALKKLGGGGSRVRPIRNIDTGFSRTFARDKRSQGVRLDPTIRDLEEETLVGLRGLFQRFQELPAAVVSPFRRNLDQARAQLARGFGRRGLGGSSLVGSFLQGQAREDETAAGELLARTNFDVGNAERSVINDISNIKRDRTQRELSALGIGQDIARLVLGADQFNAQQSRNSFLTGASILGRGLASI